MQVLPRGEEAGSGGRVYPRPPETGSALLRSAQDRPEHPGISAAGGGTVAAGGGSGGQTLAGQVRHYQPLITQIIAQTERRGNRPIATAEILL